MNVGLCCDGSSYESIWMCNGRPLTPFWLEKSVLRHWTATFICKFKNCFNFLSKQNFVLVFNLVSIGCRWIYLRRWFRRVPVHCNGIVSNLFDTSYQTNTVFCIWKFQEDQLPNFSLRFIFVLVIFFHLKLKRGVMLVCQVKNLPSVFH